MADARAVATRFETTLLLALSLAGAVLRPTGVAGASPGDGSAAPATESRHEASAAPDDGAESTAGVAGLDISFRMDPRLTRGVYMGDRWISPPTYVLNAPGPDATIDARAHAIDAAGQRVDVQPGWMPADPEMVTVAPLEGSDVSITVHRAGETRLDVSAGGVSKDLTVRATPKGRAFLVEIVQVPVHGTAEAEERARILAGHARKTSYALGLEFGRRVVQQAGDVDADSLARGVEDALARKALLTEDELRAALGAHYSQIRTRQTREQHQQRRRELLEKKRERLAERRELAEKNRRDGAAFLAENATREDVVTLDSGLQYKVLEAGGGETPTADDTVACHYRGTLLDGTEFDTSRTRGGPGTFALNRVIGGWREALPLMSVGSKWQLFVPPELGYGVRGTRGIPPNATLVFEVELLSIQEGSRARRQKKDEASPDVVTTGQAAP